MPLPLLPITSPQNAYSDRSAEDVGDELTGSRPRQKPDFTKRRWSIVE